MSCVWLSALRLGQDLINVIEDLAGTHFPRSGDWQVVNL